MAVTVNEIQRRTGEAINKGIVRTQDFLEKKYPTGQETITSRDMMKIFQELKNNIRAELTNANTIP